MEKKLHVDGMTCKHCVGRVKKIIEDHPGTENVSVRLDAKEASFSCGDGVEVAAIVQAINEFGFSALEKA